MKTTRIEKVGVVLLLSAALPGCHFGLEELLGKQPEGGEAHFHLQASCNEESFGEQSTTSDASGCASVEGACLKGVIVPEDNVLVIQVGKLSDETYPRAFGLSYEDAGISNGPQFSFTCAAPAENPDRRTANIRCTGPNGTRIRASAQEPSDVQLRIGWLTIAHSTCYNSITYARAPRWVLCGTGGGPGWINGVTLPKLWRGVP